ncbi:MAG: 1-(5-phosphoribosyl)-5-[(5-phosphoribosylamino)methylideneamino]imidazole-4-carboxamide isomerase [Bacteroidales bacterium]|nr:1-(5-phosphoribosyl)-5-[(5-phosphoribosylamino)methylideneamino]imidazole-4-carboxamide isomerase [Bacteroidales bacterium]
MIELVPAIDIIDGKCVRLSQGDFTRKTIYNEDPVEVALEFEANGIRRLHIVDLDGAKAHHIVNWRLLEMICAKTALRIDFGGGLKSTADLEIAFSSGAQMVTGGSIAVKEPEEFAGWIEKYGAEKIILGADVKDDKIAVGGWMEDTDIKWDSFIQEYISKGIEKVISTDISKDGMLEGPSLDLYQQMLKKFPTLYLIASGGISSVDDIAALESIGVPSVIFGKAIYEGKIKLRDLLPFLD